MLRRLNVNTEKTIVVGYNYLITQFYVTNKDTTTYRNTAEEVKEIIDIVCPDNTISLSAIVQLSVIYETLEALYYTLSETGSYISSIQLNDHEEYPLCLNPDTNALFIKNSNLIFNLTLNESIDLRVGMIQSFYKEHVGIQISLPELREIYNVIVNTYKPYVYNLITDSSTTPVVFSNSFASSNWSKKGKGTYECVTNPYNTFTNTNTIPTTYIEEINSSTNTITTVNNIPSSLTPNTTISITGTTVEEPTYTYSADGEYTIQSVTDNTIVTKEAIASPYTYNYPKAYINNTTITIDSIDRDTATVTLSDTVPDNITIGDIVYINNTQQTINNETVSCDGEYIVGSISENTITLQTQPNTNYTYTEGTQATLTKRTFISNVISIVEDTDTPNYYLISLRTPETRTLTINNIVVITYNNTTTTYTLKSYDEATLTCEFLSGELTEYSVDYPLLQIPIPSSEILIQVTESSNPDNFPTGEFLVNNFTQCQEYLATLDGLVVPTNTVYNNIGKEPQNIPASSLLPEIVYKGLFSPTNY